MIGAFGIIIGLYVVLWGKTKDFEELKEKQVHNEEIKSVQVLVDGSKLAEPLLSKEID